MRSKRLITLLAAGGAVSSCFLTPLQASAKDPGGNTYSSHEQPVRAIPYRPLQFADLSRTRGALIGPRSQVRLPDGSVVTGSHYLAMANEYEPMLNARGDSLVDRPDALSTIEEARDRALREANADVNAVMERSNSEMVANPPGVPYTNLSRLRTGVYADGGGNAERVYPWHYEKGSRDNAAVVIDGKVVFRASKSLAELNGYLNVDGYLCGKKYQILGVEYLADAPATGAGRTIGTVTVGGFKKWTRDKTGNFAETSLLTQEWPLWSPKATQVTVKFSIYGVPVVARAGIEGVVGVQLKASLRELGAGLGTIPYTQIRAFAEAAADLVVVKFGIEGDLSLVKYSVPIWAYGEARISNGRWALKATIDTSNDITAGEGKIYAFVDPLGLHKFKQTIVSWGDLFKWSGQLYKEEYWQFL